MFNVLSNLEKHPPSLSLSPSLPPSLPLSLSLPFPLPGKFVQLALKISTPPSPTEKNLSPPPIKNYNVLPWKKNLNPH